MRNCVATDVVCCHVSFSKLDLRLVKIVNLHVFDFRVEEVLKHVVSDNQVQPSVQTRKCLIQWLLKQELLHSTS